MENYKKFADELRMLTADIVENANSGHPGAPMGLSDIACVLTKYINLNPSNPSWQNRDRIVFSGGHVSALIYSLMHLWGFDISLDDLKLFRKLDSKTPGHPEFVSSPFNGIEITTGPLGQGIANSVGFALASKKAIKKFGNIIDHKIYCFCGDGDLQEGISYEACSIAGLHKLSNLIIIYDSNNISIEGDISNAFNEDVRTRFISQGFNVICIDGHDFKSIDNAFKQALISDVPTLIIAKTKIARHAYKLEGSHKTHGAPLGEEIIRKTKESLNLSTEKFFISNETYEFFNLKQKGQLKNRVWDEINNIPNQELKFPDFVPFKQGDLIPTRTSNGEILNSIAKINPFFIGGSADLAPSNNTHLNNLGEFPDGQNMHFGIREHAMGAICNGIANYGIFTPFCATFFVFSDYLIPSIRLASIMKLKIFYIFTHDSIGVGEDGATHQPIEQLSHLRAMPNIINYRPCDANENITCWKFAITKQTPQAFILSRQKLKVIDSVETLNIENVKNGAYVISSSKIYLNEKSEENKGLNKLQLSIIASGSEIELALNAQKMLENEGISTQVISMPSFDIFLETSKKTNREYDKNLFLDSKILAIEALRGLELYYFAHSVICMEDFGKSANGDVLFNEFGFFAENIVKESKKLLGI